MRRASEMNDDIQNPAEHPPQRFRWRTRGYARWKYGCCVHMPTWERWMIHTFGLTGEFTFESDPWEVMGQVLCDVAEFQWLDNDLNWQGDVMPATPKN